MPQTGYKDDGRAGNLSMAVVGVGHLGSHHARLLAEMDGVDLVAVSDTDAGKGRAAAQKYAVDYVPDYRSLEGRIKAVSIAVPTSAHYEVGRFFLAHGVHTLVEKPLTASLKDAEELVAMAEESDLRLMVGHTERFNPAIIEASKHIDQPMFIEAHRIGAFPGRSTDIDVVMDIMIHDIDLVLSLDRSGIRDLQAVGVQVLTADIDIANARVRMNSGCVANLTASRVSQEKLRKVRIFGRQLYLSVDCARQSVRKVTVSPKEPGRMPVIDSGYLEVPRDEPLRLELEAFVNAVRGGGATPVDGRAGLAALRASHAILQDIRSGLTG